MPLTFGRTKSKRAEGYLQPRTIVASARKINLKLARRTPLKQKEWQQELWAYFDEVPEFKFLLLWRGNQMAKVRFYPATVDPNDPDGNPIPLTAEAADVPQEVVDASLRIMKRFRSQIGGQTEIQRRLEICMESSGECHIVGRWPRDDSGNIIADASRDDPGWDWFVVSTSELSYKQGRGMGQPGVWQVKRSPDAKADEVLTLDNERDVMFRVWQAHGQYAELADCSARALASELEWLYLLSAQGKQEARSRFSAGILLLPNGLSVGAAPPGDAPDAMESEDGEEARSDPVMDSISEVLTAVVEDPEDNGSIVPLALRGKAEDLAQVRLLSLARQSDSTLDDKIEERVRRLARGMNAPAEVVEGHMQCADETTQIMTSHGWRRYDELSVDDEVLTLDHVSGFAEWQHVERVSVFDVESHPMMLMRSKSHSSLTTLDHHWPIVIAQGSGKRAWRDSKDILSNHRFVTAAPLLDVASEAKWSDALVELIAWFYTEGSVDRRSYRDGGQAIITQDECVNPGNVERISAALTRLCGDALSTLRGTGPNRWHDGPRTRGWVERVDKNRSIVRFRLSHELTRDLETLAPDRVPSFEFLRSLTSAQLSLFLDVSRLADGWVSNSGTIMFSQNDERRVDAYEMAAILAGFTPSRWSVDGQKRYEGTTQHLCSLSSRTTVQPRRPKLSDTARFEQISYSGRVWCPTVANGTWLARREGRVYFTGNTTFANAKQIAKDTWEDYLQPRALFNGDALTVGYYRPELVQEVPDIDPQLLDRLFVWYDESDLVEHPNLAAVAVEAFDRFGISWAAFRDALGFGEDDAPDPLEILLRLAIGPKTVLTPNVVTAILNGMEGGEQLPEPTAPAQEGGDASVTPPAQARSMLQLPDIARLILMSMLEDERQKQELIEYTQQHSIESELPRSPDRQLARGNGSRSKRQDRGLRAGRKLMQIDRELRTRLIVAANASMDRALEKAGNRLRSKAKTIKSSALRNVAPIDVARTLGRQLVADAGGEDEALAGAFDDLEEQFIDWSKTAGQQAIDVVYELVGGFSSTDRDRLKLRLADSADEAWTWMKDTLTQLAQAKLYDPSPTAAPLGEFDPSLRVPPGLVRQAITRAGGMAGVHTNGATDGPSAWVALSDGDSEPAGGIATGEIMQSLWNDEGATVDGYQWEYGPALRLRSFEPHEDLDGVGFVDFDDDQLANGDDFPPFPYYMPGDHQGCMCDIIPILLPAE